MPRYLEINSSYRMRDDWPEPGQFDVIAGNTSEDSPPEALYLPELPEYTFQYNTYGSLSPFIAPYSQTTPRVIATSQSTLNGYTISDTAFPGDEELILSFDESQRAMRLRLPLKQAPVAGNLARIVDPTPQTYPPNGAKVYYNIQTNGRPFQQTPITTAVYYVGYYLHNDDAPPGTVDAQPIINYDTAKLQVTIANPLKNSGPYTTGHQFSIRKYPPFYRGASIVAVNAKRNIVQLDAGASSDSAAYTGKYLYIHPNFFDEAMPNYNANKLTLGMYVFKITSYNGTTKEARLETSISAEVSAPLVGRKYEVLNHVQDSYSPLQYVMSTTALSEPRCMKVSLITLILPNVQLVSGSRIAFYPFVYVELRNESSAKTMGQNLIYSNNPNSGRAVFVCPIFDISRPTRTPFIKINSAGMTQTMKFKPNDTFFFRVYLPDGTLFQPVALDNPPPLQPNPLLQIEAVFSFADI